MRVEAVDSAAPTASPVAPRRFATPQTLQTRCLNGGGNGSVEHQAAQAGGERLDPFRTDRIFALDERLTRQFEKALAMLIKVRELRLAGSAGG